eukprot:g6163.t1
MAGDLDLPPPGPFLHSGLFRKRTIVEVHRCVQRLKSGEDVREVLDRLGDFVVDGQVLQQTSIAQELASMASIILLLPRN